MCIKNVVLFDCGHTRTLSYVCKYPKMECCPNTKRNLIPEEGGYGIEAPILKDKWMCALRCQPGVPAHEPLIDLAKEDIMTVKKDIEHQIEILSVLSTPSTTPGVTPVATPGLEGGVNFDERFAASLSRRRSGLTPAHERPALQWRTSSSRSNDVVTSPEARDDLSFNFTNMKLKIPMEKLNEAGVKEEAMINNGK